MKLRQIGTVSFPIKQAALAVGGAADLFDGTITEFMDNGYYCSAESIFWAK
jgi:hypothetical protein